jgi:hypothetical protein
LQFYRTTPYSITGQSNQSLSALLFGRTIRTSIDLLHPDVRLTVERKQLYDEERRNEHKRPVVTFKEGEDVFVRQWNGPKK